MRFVSKYSRFRIVCKHEKIEILASGLPRVLAPGFTAEFKQSDVTDWEREEARKRFKFSGTVRDDSGRDLDPITRISSFDTSTISGTELREEIRRLENLIEEVSE